MRRHNKQTILSILLAALLTLNFGCTSTPNRESTGQFFDSSMVTATIKARLIDDPITGGFRIKVTTYKGEVQLSGFVNTALEKKRATLIAQQVAGVSRVINNMVIKSR